MLAAIPFPNIEPEIFSIQLGPFGFALRWYALAYIAGILVGWRLAVRAMRTARIWSGPAPMSAEQVEAMMTWIVLGIVLGGRLGFVLFYQPGYYLTHPLEIPMIWQGGMSFHGGFLGVIAAVIGFSRVHGVRLSGTADILALGTPPGIFFGRIANFINAELWGGPSTLPWAVTFPGAAAQDCGQALGQLCARHPSQLYEAGLEGLLLGSVLLYLAFRRGWLQTPWAATGTFLVGYGLARIFVELYRQSDAQFITQGNPQGYVVQLGSVGLSMGQLLSLPMLVIGLIVLVRARRR